MNNVIKSNLSNLKLERVNIEVDLIIDSDITGAIFKSFIAENKDEIKRFIDDFIDTEERKSINRGIRDIEENRTFNLSDIK